MGLRVKIFCYRGAKNVRSRNFFALFGNTLSKSFFNEIFSPLSFGHYCRAEYGLSFDICIFILGDIGLVPWTLNRLEQGKVGC